MLRRNDVKRHLNDVIEGGVGKQVAIERNTCNKLLDAKSLIWEQPGRDLRTCVGDATEVKEQTGVL